MVRAPLVLVLLAGLGGCTMGPDYHLPQGAAANLPAARAALADEHGLTVPDDLPPRWWHLYDDPVLDRLEEQALAGSTDLRVAAANLARARAVSQAAEGQKEPDLTVDAAAERARLSAESFLLEEPLPAFNLGTGQVELSYQADLFGRVKRSVEAAHADEEARRALVDAVKVTLAGEVARAYLEVCGGQETAAVAGEALQVQEHLADAAGRMAAAGRGTALDITAAGARVAEARAALPPARARAKAGLYRLAFLLGRAPADYPREAEACVAVPELVRPLPVGDGAALIARRPDLRAAERELAAATARIGVATADLYPRIGFGIAGGSSGLLADLGTAPANFWSIGSLIHWSFPGAGARAKVRAANADADGALARFDGAVLGALREAQTTLSKYGEDHDRAENLRLAAEAADKGAAQMARLHAAGKAAAQSDLGGKAAAIAARSRALDAREAVVGDQIALFMALGGGW
ncbi:efflux transporter outer membrane subunit [Novosphingobium flavum]|uniref:Efflux transporter outer membrane subunit n=1 Tax=Novosphingobium flavum TaxID=1778672 RepID=A0A7X1FSF8_9SPHN|nr:efflux transporter outer membrane subunit [Novosphingobium flavum]